MHCIIEFERKETKKPKDDREYLESKLGELLTDALAACAKERPENAAQFVSEYLKEHS